MNDEHVDPIETLFHRARELSREEQSRFLNERCGKDSSVRRKVETLLREDSTPLGPLDAGIAESLATTLSPGMVIGPYEVVSVAGIGGMGQVYRAVDRRLKRDVAIKALPAEFIHDWERMERLRGEATVLASLNHPNIAAIYDVIEKEDQPHCLVLEFVPGETLAELSAGSNVDTDGALRIAHQIATALEAAHEKGIVHRDLKPSNIKRTPDAKVKLLDFGLARAFGNGTAGIPSHSTRRVADPAISTGLAGTPSYMSPEQAQGMPVDQRADIWSFGCIVYELLTGQKAFWGRSPEDIFSTVLHGEPDWTLLPTDTPEELTLLLRQCLQKNTAVRLGDSSHLRRTLDELEKKQNVPVRTSVTTVTVPRGSGRRIIWKATVVLLLVLSGTIGGATWPRPRAPRASHVEEANRKVKMALKAWQSSQLEQLEHGRELLQEALELDPEFAAARELLGFSYWGEIDGGYSNNLDLLDRAESELRQALKADSQSAYAHAHLGKVYYYQHRKEKLKEESEKALAIDSANREGMVGSVLYDQLNGDFDKAQVILQDMLASDPTFDVALLLYAENLRQSGDYLSAIREYRKLFDHGLPGPASRIFLAQAYQTSGNTQEARALLDGVAPADRRNYIFRLIWSLQLALEGKREEALREMEDPDLQKYAGLVYYSLNAAEIYAVLGETEKALDWLRLGILAGDERVEWFERDPHLKNIRDLPTFKRMVAPLRER